MSWMQTPSLAMLERFLDLTAFRQTLVVSNLANIDTPRYRTVDMDFGESLRNAAWQLDSAPVAPVAREVPGLVERPDGNNVSLERETLLLAETQMRFRIAVELVRGEIRRVRTAIEEGKQG